MPYTANDLVVRALRKVTVARIAEAEDITDATAYVDPFLAKLIRRQIIPYMLSDDLPEEYLPDLVTAFVEEIAPDFGGRPSDPAMMAMAETRLRSLLPAQSYPTVRACYF